VQNANRWLALSCAAAMLLCAACTSSSNSSETSNTAASSVPASAAPNGMMGGSGGGGMMAGRSPAPIPATLHCGTGAIVWVNLSRKDYHLPGDRFYGKSRNGKYMCQSDAEAAGYHMAGMPGKHTGSTMASPQPANT
jgi:hypothetical protein